MAVNRIVFELSNGNKFHIKRYDAFLSLKILGEVQKRFLVPIAGIMEANDEKNTPEVRLEAIMKAIEKVSTSLDGESLVHLAKTVLNENYISVSIDGDAPQMLNEGILNLAVDGAFDLVSLIVEVMRVNYQELFTRSRSLIGRAQADMAIH